MAKRKNNPLRNIIAFAIIVICLLGAKFYFSSDIEFPMHRENAQTRATEEAPTPKELELPKDNSKEYIGVYFMYVKPDGENVFTKIQRELPQGENRLNFAINELIKGPNADESSKKYYSEIPAGTKVLSVMENEDKVIINLSSDFQYGGGSDSLYSRMQQLLKTVLANTSNKKIYLYLDGQQADVIGGEGIMIKQPLEEDSLFDE